MQKYIDETDAVTWSSTVLLEKVDHVALALGLESGWHVKQGPRIS